MIPLPVATLIDMFRIDGGLAVEVPSAPTFDALRRAVPGATTLVTVDPIAVHPIRDGRELERLGVDRNRTAIKVYARDATSIVPRAVISYEGEQYEVHPQKRMVLQGSHVSAIAISIEVTA